MKQEIILPRQNMKYKNKLGRFIKNPQSIAWKEDIQPIKMRKYRLGLPGTTWTSGRIETYNWPNISRWAFQQASREDSAMKVFFILFRHLTSWTRSLWYLIQIKSNKRGGKLKIPNFHGDKVLSFQKKDLHWWLNEKWSLSSGPWKLQSTVIVWTIRWEHLPGLLIVIEQISSGEQAVNWDKILKW